LVINKLLYNYKYLNPIMYGRFKME
jgi:hypothetical protein